MKNKNNPNRLIAIIEARMSSERLPEKVLLNINSLPTIMHLINRLKNCSGIDEIVVATTISTSDDKLCEFLKSRKVQFYRGSESDVLSRLYYAAKKYKASHILKFGADCPFTDIQLIQRFVNLYSILNVDFVSNTIIRSFPDGMDVGIMKFEALKKAHQKAIKMSEREHTSLYVRSHPEAFSLVNIGANPEHYLPNLPLTLDTKEDYLFLCKIAESLNHNNLFSLNEILVFLKKNPKLLTNIKKIERKGDN